MAARFGWQQKWSATGLQWDAAWSEGFALGTPTIASTARSTLAGGLSYGVLKSLGALSLASTARSGLQSNVVFALPTVVSLGTVSVASRARSTVAGSFDSVDPRWLDPPFVMTSRARCAFPNPVTIAVVLAKSLGALTLNSTAHSTLSPVTFSYGVLKPLGALSIASVAGCTVAGGPVHLRRHADQSGAGHAGLHRPLHDPGQHRGPAAAAPARRPDAQLGGALDGGGPHPVQRWPVRPVRPHDGCLARPLDAERPTDPGDERRPHAAQDDPGV